VQEATLRDGVVVRHDDALLRMERLITSCVEFDRG